MLIVSFNNSSPGVFDIKSSLCERRNDRIGIELSARLADKLLKGSRQYGQRLG
jgi:hypothetical protein